MSPAAGIPRESFWKVHPAATYFVLTFAISWTGAFLFAAPLLLHRQPIPKMTGILMFPVMLLGPSGASLLLTGIVDGRAGLRDLRARLVRIRQPLRWYLPVLLPPVVVLTVLTSLAFFVSPTYTPNHFLLGIAFGVPAGLLEEIGWSGFAFPKMRARASGLKAGLLLGLLWGIWHLPVIDYLGASARHGVERLEFWLAFTLAMIAVRVLISWIYDNTQSVWLAQLTHIASTSALAAFSPPGVTAAQEIAWYVVYGMVLWLVVGTLIAMLGRTFRQSPTYR
jgi:membrane protease YdiL (CAAX protease family)